MRRPVATAQRPRSRIESFAAPTRGLVLAQSPVQPVPQSAEVLENGIPTQRGVRIRGGLQAAATVGEDPVTSLFVYNHPTLGAIFAATADSIFDISGFDPDTAPTAEVTGQTAGYYSIAQIGAVGGDFLYAVNGADDALLFDGSTWTPIDGASTPAITGATTANFSAVWLYRNRLFFVEKNTLKAWYLGVDSISGAANDVSLAGVFQKGGSLLLGATWSLDSGDGLDDKCVFISTEGEVAIYSGSDPSDAADWTLEGRYDIAKPLGVNGTMQAGGDLLIATVDGIVPLSQVIQKDPAALSFSAVTAPIETLWAFEAARATEPVELVKWSDRGLAFVTLPDATRVLTVNLQTGAWGVQTNWAATCGAVFLGKGYIGRADGSIVAIDETGFDVDQPYTMRLCHGFQDFGDPAAFKVAQFLRFTFFAPGDITVRGSVAVDFDTTFPPAPNEAGIAALSDFLIWDVDNWDEKLWWSESVQEATNGLTQLYMAVSGAGYALAPQLQITSGQATKPNIELVRTDFGYQPGGAVV